MARLSTRPHAGSLAETAEAALDLAQRAHAGQLRRQSGTPFVEHPIAVAWLLSEAGHDGDAIAAAYLHDAVEKTGLALEEIRDRIGDDVADLVAALSEDPTLADYAERKRALRRQVLVRGRPATTIYAADRLMNVRDWTTLPAERREGIATSLGTSVEERLRLWREDLSELSDHDPELPFLAALELEVSRLPARDAAAAGPGPR